MDRCPSCSHSRWVYSRSVPAEDLVTSLTGRRPFECLSCGWRGWLRSNSRPSIFVAIGLPQISASAWGHAVRASCRLRDLGSAWTERVRRQKLPRVSGLPWAVVWTGPAFALGVLLGALLLSVDGSVPDAESVQASENSPPVKPIEQAVPAGKRSPEPVKSVQSIEPPRMASPVEEPPARAPLIASAATSGSSPAPPRAAAAQATGERADASGRSRSRLPRYRGSLSIDSDPQGARVSVNGQFVGATPIVLDDLPAGSCVVRVESDGYELWSAAARVVANRQSRVSATLQRGSDN